MVFTAGGGVCGCNGGGGGSALLVGGGGGSLAISITTSFTSSTSPAGVRAAIISGLVTASVKNTPPISIAFRILSSYILRSK